MIERLREALGDLGYEVGGPELLDVLWLARAMGGSAPGAAPGTAPAPAPEAAPAPGPEATPGAAPPAGTASGAAELRASDAPLTTGRPPEPAEPEPRTHPDPEPRPDPGQGPTADQRHRLFGTTGGGGPTSGVPAAPQARARAVRAPGPRALPGLHGLARALRPLRGHRDHRFRTVVDVEATVRLTAESGVHDVVDRPEQELRHAAVLLVDGAPSMRVWEPLVGDVRRLLERGGVFRAVHLHRVDPRAARRAAPPPRTESPVTFLLTDGVDPAWRGPAGRRFLRTWQRHGPLVVLSPLPRRLWRGTAFDAQPQLLVAGRPFASDGALGVVDPLQTGRTAGSASDAVPIPVVGLSRTALGSWSRLLTRPGVPHLMDAVLLDDTGPEPPPPAPAGPDLPAEDRLDRFRASFSPEAYRLAVRLSAIRPLSAPVMQLVRIATLPESTSSVVAEVLLGDLLEPLAEPLAEPALRSLPSALGGGAGGVRYDFKPGVRDLLAGGLSTEQSIDTAEAVGRALEPHLGRIPDFAALLADPTGPSQLPAQATPFAVLVSPVLDRLYGGSGAGSLAGAGEGGQSAAQTPAEALRFTVFGRALAWRGNEPCDFGTPRRQAVLAALLLRVGQYVAREELVEDVWGEDFRFRILSHHVSLLSRQLAPFGYVIDRSSGSYRLRAAQADADLPLDLRAAERLQSRARSAQADGDPAEARRLLAEALEQLKGEALAGLPGPYAEAQRTRLEEWRLTLRESRIDLGLRLGAYAEIEPELIELTAAHPLRERIRGWLMTALYAMGRPAEALAVYEDTRRLLADELGVDPSAELSVLKQRILQSAPAESLLPLRRVPSPPLRAVPNWPPAAGLHFRVLGPARAVRDTEPLPTGSPQQRAVLARLLFADGRTVTAADLTDALWGDEPPSQALAALRTYTSRLGSVLGPGVLHSEAGGYALRIEPDALDLRVMEDWVESAEASRASGDLVVARALLGDALDLWDGEPLAGVPGPYAAEQRVRLEERRLELAETQIDLDLELGEHAEAVARLTELTAAHPLRERFREQLMLALYRSGRQAEALAVYADTRRLLREELGVEPRPALQELQLGILRGDPSLASPAAPPSEQGGEFLRPQQLPAPVPDFAAHFERAYQLADRLPGPAGAAHRPGASVQVVVGMAGVGKTAFAVHVAHLARPEFPDGQLYVDLKGAGPHPAEPQAVLGRFLRALGVPDSAVPPTLDERAARFRELLDGRRVLVLLDDARDAAQVHPLLPGTSGCAALITSRSRTFDLEGAHATELDVMSPDEALAFFARVAGEERVTAEPEAARHVVAACGYLPLALRIVGARLAARRKWTVSMLADKLADEQSRLDELRAGDLSVQVALALSYDRLGPEQARAFRLLGLADGPDLSLYAAAALLDRPADVTSEHLTSLRNVSLIELDDARQRYRFNPVVRLYARACAERDEQPPEEREFAHARLLDFYLQTATRVHALEGQGQRLAGHLEASGDAGLYFHGVDAARDWLHTEGEPLLACARRSTGPDVLRRAVDLLWVTRDLAESGGFLHSYEETTAALLEAAEAADDTRATVRAALVLCETQLLSGRYGAVEQRVERLGWMLGADPAAGEGQVRRQLDYLRGMVADHQGRHQEARAYFEEALKAFRAQGERSGAAGVCVQLARVHLALDDRDTALAVAEEAVATFETLGLPARSAHARYSLGLIHAASGRHGEARQELDAARSLFRDARQQLWEGMSWYRLAQVELADHNPEQALGPAGWALNLLSGPGQEWLRGKVLTILGRTLQALGRPDAARDCWEEALSVFEERNSDEAEAVRGLLEGVRA